MLEKNYYLFLIFHVLKMYYAICHCPLLLTFDLLPLISSTSFSHFPELLLFYFLASCQIYGGSYLQAQMFQPTSEMTVWHDSTCSMENHDIFFWLVLAHNSVSSLDKNIHVFLLLSPFSKTAALWFVSCASLFCSGFYQGLCI